MNLNEMIQQSVS